MRKVLARSAVFLLGGLVVLCAVNMVRPREGAAPPDWGLYQINWDRDYGESLDAELRKFASRPAYIMFFRDLRCSYPRRAVDQIADRGATTIISLELWHWGADRARSFLPPLVAGEYDTFLRDWARAARSDGRRVLLRFGFEFNGDWFSWAGQPELYVSAWRRAHGIFKQEGADNVEWVWAPNFVNRPRDNDMHRYYPGDEHVDWVAVDGYNFGDEHDEWHRWESFDEVFGAVLSDLESRYPDKRLMIAEMGCAADDAERRAAWIRDAWASILKRPRIDAVVWFNLDTRNRGEPNFAIDALPGSLEAFNQTFAAPREPARGESTR